MMTWNNRIFKEIFDDEDEPHYDVREAFFCVSLASLIERFNEAARKPVIVVKGDDIIGYEGLTNNEDMNQN